MTPAFRWNGHDPVGSPCRPFLSLNSDQDAAFFHFLHRVAAFATRQTIAERLGFLAVGTRHTGLSQFSSVVEQRFCKPSVVGSSPTTGSTFDAWASGGCERPGGDCQQNCQQTGN